MGLLNLHPGISHRWERNVNLGKATCDPSVAGTFPQSEARCVPFIHHTKIKAGLIEELAAQKQALLSVLVVCVHAFLCDICACTSPSQCLPP